MYIPNSFDVNIYMLTVSWNIFGHAVFGGYSKKKI